METKIEQPKVLKKKIKELITKEVDVKLPYYSSNGTFFYKVNEDNDDKVIRVFLSYNNEKTGVDFSYLDHAFSDDMKEITEQEFNEAYLKAMEVLNQKSGVIK